MILMNLKLNVNRILNLVNIQNIIIQNSMNLLLIVNLHAKKFSIYVKNHGIILNTVYPIKKAAILSCFLLLI